jgi:hypothetical protein
MSMAKVGLTELGKSKADATGEVQGLRYSIINYLNDKGSSSIAELADGVNANQSEVRTKVRQLVGERWLIWVEDDGDDGWG